jgi:alanine-glyoxylate transaminase/serine-glyoxylate transaminase/serine-pyruvate transaminase
MTSPMVGHLDPYFLQIMDKTQSLLRYVFQTSNKLTIAIPGTGSAAMEAAVANLVEPGDSVLVCVAGYFGLRLADMAGRYGGDVQTIHKPWGEAFDPAEIKAALDARPAKIVAIVQAETSTGVYQPLDEIARLVHDQGGLLIADAVTSLGGMPVRVDEIGIDAAYSGSQKCLGCPPGASPITFNERAEAKLSARQTPVANWYLDLTNVQKYWGPERTYHHTAPISLNFALYEGLRLVAEEGLENRWARHRKNAEMLWAGLADLDLTPHVPEPIRLTTLTTVRIPEGVDDMAVRGRLLRETNIEIAGGLGELKGKVWRVGLMGYSSREENVVLLLAALARLLNS